MKMHNILNGVINKSHDFVIHVKSTQNFDDPTYHIFTKFATLDKRCKFQHTAAVDVVTLKIFSHFRMSSILESPQLSKFLRTT